MATALVFSPETIEAIRRVREHAEHPANWRRLGPDQVVTIPGDIAEFTVEIPLGFKTVYSIDHDGERTARHLSVSLHDQDGNPKGIGLVVMQQIMELYEFGGDAITGTIPGDPPWVVHAFEPHKEGAC